MWNFFKNSVNPLQARVYQARAACDLLMCQSAPIKEVVQSINNQLIARKIRAHLERNEKLCIPDLTGGDLTVNERELINRLQSAINQDRAFDNIMKALDCGMSVQDSHSKVIISKGDRDQLVMMKQC